ncbi:MAG: right-handed parallel beta-helix repeat-containing protein, partial [Planctomycetes bacterium]|nr:right-handed parallel beta-helix repeat-containing protein [Planctomycetota bacterium]
NGEGLLLEGCLIRDSEVRGISFTCQKDQTAAPIVIRNNWVVNPGNTGIGGSGSSDKLTVENQNGSAPGRSPVLIEHNTIIANNWAGFPSFWESGGMKVFKLTGCVIRYNTIVSGSGPGIWLDWEHYGNRLEGNLFRNAWALCVGIEASPGPNLIANNLSVNLRPGPAWFREAILSWSTDRNWAVNNTIDGRWNPLPAWQGLVGADGLYLGESGPNRGTRWCPLDNRRQAYLNNLVVGCHSAVRAKPEDLVAANVTDQGTGAVHLDQPPAFVNPEREDYRLKPGSPLNNLGVENEQTKLARHDFHGLLRFPDAGRTVGAFRFEPTPKPDAATLIEVEFRDGS